MHPARAVLADRPVHPHGEPVGGEWGRSVVAEGQRRGVGCGQLGHRPLAGLAFIGRSLRVVARQHDVLPPKEDVFGRPWLPVGPAQARSELQRPHRRLFVRRPSLDETRTDVQSVVQIAQQRMPVAELTVGVCFGGALARECRHTEDPAILARLHPPVRDDIGVGRQPLVDGRQLAGLDQGRELGRLVEAGRLRHRCRGRTPSFAVHPARCTRGPRGAAGARRSRAAARLLVTGTALARARREAHGARGQGRAVKESAA